MDILMRYRYITIQWDTRHWKFKFVKSLSLIFPGQPLQFSHCKAIYGRSKSKSKPSCFSCASRLFLRWPTRWRTNTWAQVFIICQLSILVHPHVISLGLCVYFSVWRCSRTPAVLQDTLVLGLLHSEAGYQSLLNILGTGVDTVDRLVSLGR